jgi:hypothetical protein
VRSVGGLCLVSECGYWFGCLARRLDDVVKVYLQGILISEAEMMRKGPEEDHEKHL